ncbi:hypothetical protein FQV26_04290 [Planococcus sp. CPCC 101016]|uniref:hypothetical protein n=1 Tax=Planococcus sp. CPCC 101016 TaxID=2599617 RepID=UPI0011B7783A|nr:hypothetical protein [Planococcus sp. CPCC 101016]TWT07040.1 hypothetical protein FQV26_04290 [Planococcus sp. CPCC 101016]
MNDYTINLNKVTLFFVLFLSILPFLNIGSFGVPVLYLLTPIGMFILLILLLGKIAIPYVLKPILIICGMIVLEVFLSAFYGSVSAFGTFKFPTDSIQYIVRFLFLISFSIIFYKNKVDAKVFIKYFLIVANIGMLIGVLQWIPWAGRLFLVEMYPFTKVDIQLAHLDRSLHAIRVHGIAQFATANGGLATFFFIFAYSVYKYSSHYKLLSISLIFLSILNIVTSQARAGMLALVFAVILLYLIDVYIYKKSFKPTIYFSVLIIVVYAFGYSLYQAGNEFVETIVFRWTELFKTNGGERTDQIEYGISLLDSPMDYLFGLSKVFQSQGDLNFFIEVEPVNILVLYGAIGFFFQYSLILFISMYFLKNIKRNINNKEVLVLIIASLVGLLSYQVFSTGYYFYREIRVGLFPWILMGVAIGVNEMYKKEEISANQKKINFKS